MRRNGALTAVIAIALLMKMQAASFGQEANSEKIIADKSGKYISIESDQLFLLNKGWFARIRCAKPADGIITARIGKSLFHLPDASVRSAMANALAVSQGTEKKYKQYYDANVGCTENPINFSIVELIPPASGTAPEFSIKATPDHQGLTKTAQGLLSLRDNAEQRGCQSGGNHTLLICTGSDGTGPVAYILAADKGLTLQSGAPLNMKCNLAPTLVCGVSDDIAGDVTYTAVVTGDVKDFSVKQMQEAHEAARKTTEAMREH